jgi:RNA-binding protein
MSLTKHQKNHLRRLGHALEPVLATGGGGLTPGLLAEFTSTLDHHELIKVRVRSADRASRDAMIRALCEHSGAELVQRIGHVALFWKANSAERRIMLPGA